MYPDIETVEFGGIEIQKFSADFTIPSLLLLRASSFSRMVIPLKAKYQGVNNAASCRYLLSYVKEGIIILARVI